MASNERTDGRGADWQTHSAHCIQPNRTRMPDAAPRARRVARAPVGEDGCCGWGGACAAKVKEGEAARMDEAVSIATGLRGKRKRKCLSATTERVPRPM